MDKDIPEEVLAGKRKKTILIIVISVAVLVLAIWLLRSSFKSSLSVSEITTAVVETGTMENTISASGEILPEFEQVITSPVSASIKNVVMDAGPVVKTGQSILSLDKEALESEYQKLRFQLASERNSIEKLRLELDKRFYDVKSNNDIKQLRINSLQASVEDAKRLFKAGGGTKESIEQAELTLKVAQLEKKQLELDDRPLFINADQQQIEQVLINIIKNAIEAIDTKGIVTFSSNPSPLQLIIMDTGSGISPANGDLLFSPFFSTKKDGQGIGLTLVKEILLNHHFDFSLKTVAPHQTEFVIKFN